ncbi:MAG: InlB B-repeat-containing protein [Pseudobutyrivibrio sp.]|uniref:InlB B-repeat-containing protein n=1 Tax=Pseudobutyrivibrio sp. TaxID=2014367 RepID=UPI0025E80C34|nr:InlB B-repeat-containing protein [Pseudobutyrivibrio sp.]MBQ6463255.1 InlB B-repeat-containing protein [Pseudobutyrivibrio sp.]
MVEEPAVEAASEEVAPVETTPEVVVEEAGEQEVVGDETPVTLTIKYEAGVEGEDITMPSDTTKAGTIADGESNVEITAQLTSTVPERSGYTFAGWKLTKKGEVPSESEVLDPGADYTTQISADITYVFTAQWTEHKVTITFDANGGTGAAMDAQTILYSNADSQNLVSCTYTNSGKKFLGWGVAPDSKVYVTQASQEWMTSDTVTKTLYAIWGDKFNLADYEVKVSAPAYDGEKHTLGIANVTVEKGSDTVNHDKYDVVFKKGSETITNYTDAGTYSVTVTAKENDSDYVGSKTVEFKVAKKTLTASIADGAIDKGGKTAEGLDRKEIGDATDRVFALYYNRTATATGARGTVADEVKPVVTLSEDASVLSPYGDDADYTVEYVDNNKEGTAKAVVTLSTEAAKNYTFVENVVGKNKEFASYEVKFTIKDYSTINNVAAGKVTTEKATLSDTGSTAGKKYGYDQFYFKYVEKEIPAINFNTIELKGDRSQDKLDAIGFETIKDTTGKVVYGNADSDDDILAITDRKTTDGKEGIVTLSLKSGNNDYEGKCEVKYTFAEMCEGQHKWHKHIRPANFGANYAGSYRWECELDGTAAQSSTDLAEIKLIDSTVTADTLSGTIAPLNDSDVAFKLSNGKSIEDVSVTSASSEAKIGYRGNTITASDFVFKTTDSSPKTIKVREFDGKKFDKDIFTVSCKNNNKVGTGTVVVKFTDVIPEYAGAEFTYDFTIKTAAEDVAAPNWSVSKPAYTKGANAGKYSYGTKVSFATTTTDAKIYYVASKEGEAANTDWIPSNGDIEVIKNAIADKKLTLYQNPVEITDDMTYMYDPDNDSDTENSIERVEFYAVAVKGDGFAYNSVRFDMVPAASDWGDVEEWDYDDTKVTDATDLPKGLWISKASMSAVDGRTYNGYAQSFANNVNSSYVPRVFFHNKLLEASDFTVKFTNNVNAWTEEGVEADMYAASKAPTVTITGKGEYAGGYQETFEIEPLEFSSEMTSDNGTPDDDTDDYPYTKWNVEINPATTLTVPENGKIQKPKFKAQRYDSIPKNGKWINLAENKDFKVDYSEVEEEAGNYTITVNGTGNYAGEKTFELTVSPVGLYLNNAKVTIDTKDVVFDGTPQAKNVKTTVKIGDVELTEGTDYDVYFSHQLSPRTYLTEISKTYNTSSLLSAGKYYVSIIPSAGSKFLGYYGKEINITNKTTTAITKAKITGIGKTAEYDNPYFDIEATYAGTKLVEGKDYLVGYSFDENEQKVGNAKVTVYGIGKYSGAKTYSYKITGIDVKNFIVDYDAEAHYDGTNIWPGEVLRNIKYQPDANVELSSISALVENTDYEVVYNNKADYTNVGTKSFTIVGMGRFSGKKTFKYKVVPFDVNADQANIEYNEKGFITANNAQLKFNYQEVSATAYKYARSFTGSPVQPKVDGVMPSDMTEAQYNTWVKQNFSFKYSNDYKKVGGVVTVTVTPKKNFKGSPVKMYYTVNKGDMASAVITVPDRVTGAWAAVKPTVTLGGKKLAEGAKKDYTVNAYFAKDTKLTNGTGKKAVEVTRAKYTEPQKGDIIPAGTEIIVKVTGNNNYTNYKEVSFRYIAKTADISKASVKVAGKYVYNGQDILLNKDDISVVLNKAVVPSQNFEIVSYTYPKTGYGTAKVRLHGVGDFGGYKDATFKIDKASMNYMVEFKYNNTDSKDAKKVLTVTGSTKTLSKNQNAFVLPKSGFTAKYVVTDPKTKKSTTTNYILKEWNTKADGTGNAYGVGATYKSSKDAGVVDTLYAIFEVAPAKDETYTITFDQGEKTVTGNAPKDIKAKRGTTYKLPAAGSMKNVGKKLDGWKDSENNLYNVGATVYNLKVDSKKVAKFTAVWAEAGYKITYKTNGGRMTSTTGYYLYSATNATQLAVPEKPGYTFTGWKLNKDTTFKYANSKVELPKGTTGNITLTAQYDPKTYTIEYNVKGHAAAVTDTTKYTVGATKKDEVPVLKTVTVNTADATEFTFLGWAKDADSVKPDYAAGKAAKNLIPDSTGKVKLNAVYAEKKYAITYDLDGGKSTALLPRNFTKAGMSAVTLPGANDPSMVKAGYDFAGFVGADGKTVVTKITTAADTTLKATWKENTTKRSILFNYNGGTNAMTAEELKAWTADVTSQPVDSEVTLPTFDSSKITLANNTFKGWATSADGKVVYPDGGKITIEREDITLYAVWEKATWKISYNLDGGLFKSNDARPSSYQPGQKITVTNPTKKGYEFKEWTYEYYKTGTTGEKEEKKATSISDLEITEDVTFTANWTAKEPTLTYKDGNDIITSWTGYKSPETAPSKYKYGEESAVTLPTSDNIAKIGYTFNGWDIYAGELIIAENASSIPTGNEENLTLVANWTKNVYKLSYSGYETTDKFVGAPEEYKLPTSFADGNTGDKAKLYALADRESQTFAGWTVGEKSSTNVPATTLTLTAAALDKSESIFANWNDKTSVKLVYSDGGTGTDEQTVEVEKAYVGTKLATNTFTKAGHTFAGWNLGKVGTPLTEANINSATGDPKTLKVTATWTKWTNTVIFKENGHGSAPATKEFAYIAEVKDTDKVSMPTISDEVFFTFLGWSTSPSATTPDSGLAKATTGDATKYYLNPTKNKQTTVLYAVWEEAKHATIKYDLDGGVASLTYADKPVYVASTVGLATTPTKDGYTFGGWLEQKTGVTDTATTREVTESEVENGDTITFKAKWTAKTPVVTLKLDGGTLTGAEVGEAPVADKWTKVSSNAERLFTVGTALTLPAATEITKAGYTFDGWYTSDAGNITDDSELVTAVPATAKADVTYIAKWTAFKSVVSFDLNGGKLNKGAAPIKDVEIPYGYEGTDKKAVAGSSFARTGYTFAGWNTKADGTGTDYAVEADLNVTGIKAVATTGSGESEKVADAVQSHTLYAKWTPWVMTISFDDNDDSVENTIANKTVTYGSSDSVTAPAAPTNAPAEKKFKEWNTKADGTGTAYVTGAELKNAFQPTEADDTATLYAIWVNAE